MMSKTSVFHMHYRPLIAIVFGFSLLSGCADSSTTKRSARERQEDALNDPFNYGPQQGKSSDVPSVLGDKDSKFDKKSFDRDMNRVFNP